MAVTTGFSYLKHSKLFSFAFEETLSIAAERIAAMEKPLATRTLIAVTSEASRIAFIVVIDSSL